MIFTVVSILPLILISIVLITSFKNYYIGEEETIMFRKANTIATDLVASGFFGEENNKNYLGTINAISEGRTLIVNANGSVIFDSNFIETGKLYATEDIIKGLKGESSFIYSKEDKSGKVITPIIQSETKEILGVIVLSNSFNTLYNNMEKLESIATMTVIIFVMIITLLSFYTSGLLTKPFTLFIHYIEGATKGHIDEKKIIYGNNEIEAISTSFNHMIERFLEVEDNRQQFVANVSHELKTPLSSMKVLAESILSQDDVAKEVYREFLEDINNEIDREAKIISDLLTLVTLDKKENSLNITKVNVNEWIESILKRLKPLAGKKNIQMIFESYRSVVAEIDETKLTLAVSNLVENAIKYNKDFGLITATLNADHKEFELVIKDTGIGIPEDSLDKIFERFYRIDKTRSRDTGGTGLGLSIVQRTVLMHNGTVRCESILEKGTKFIVKIPLKHIT